jgi:hypothetical protein
MPFAGGISIPALGRYTKQERRVLSGKDEKAQTKLEWYKQEAV